MANATNEKGKNEMVNKPKYDTREKWLLEAVALMTPLFEKAGYKVPEKIRVSCGWPSKRGLSKKSPTIGQCWANEAASDKIAQIFISPVLSKPVAEYGVLDVLAHEVAHAVVGIKEKHNKVFTKCVRSIGLEGKPTSTFGGEEFMAQAKKWYEKLGAYPHGQLSGLKSPEKKQTTRLVKCECKSCGYTARVTRKWLEQGAPVCPIVGHGPLHFDVGGLDFEGDDE